MQKYDFKSKYAAENIYTSFGRCLLDTVKVLIGAGTNISEIIFDKKELPDILKIICLSTGSTMSYLTFVNESLGHMFESAFNLLKKHYQPVNMEQADKMHGIG